MSAISNRRRRTTPRSARRDFRRLRRRRRRLALQRSDILALIGRAFEPSDQVKALDKHQILHFPARANAIAIAIGTGGGEFFVELLRGGNVVWDGDVFFLPCEVDAAQVDGLVGRNESRGGEEGEGVVVRVAEL